MYTIQKLKTQIPIDDDKIVEFCRRWQITELALFGSVLRDDFQPGKSDVDVLVVFHPGAHWTLFDLVDIEDNLSEILGTDVDLIERESIEKSQNHLRKKEILESCKVLYAAS
jgi:predicted nucleotidyltransferase